MESGQGDGLNPCGFGNKNGTSVTNFFVDFTNLFVESVFMAKVAAPKPTDGELAILRVIWQRGPSTVREVNEVMGPKVGYTTILKLLQIMTDKGLVKRDVSQRTHIYVAAQKQATTQRVLVTDLLNRAFGGSAQKLILHALESQPTSKAELNEIRKLIDGKEKK